jgi:hypothetical protein
MMNGQPEPKVYNLNQEVSVTLKLETWNIVLGFIAEGPWKTANPLIQEIQSKLQAVLERPANQEEGVRASDQVQ